MAHFDWQRVQEISGGTNPWPWLRGRFDTASEAAGLDDWRFLVETLEGLGAARDGDIDRDSERVITELDAFIHRTMQRRPPAVPTVFVSHQRGDAGWAERAAWDATREGFEYWLDIHDPLLGLVNAAPQIAGAVRAALVAGIIEMGLLNCTHLVSLQTSNSRSSRWVPYEFGRAKERRLLARQTASWFAHGITLDPGGDYLAFAACKYDKHALRSWLRDASILAGIHSRPGPWHGPSAPPAADLPN